MIQQLSELQKIICNQSNRCGIFQITAGLFSQQMVDPAFHDTHLSATVTSFITEETEEQHVTLES